MATVRFTPQVAVFIVESHLDMTEDEIQRTWYGPEDYLVIKKRVRRTVLRLRKGHTEDDEGRGHCSRGLEHLRSQAHYEQRSINKDAVVESVMKEQEWQRRDGVQCDAEALALASATTSRWARDRARSTGISDAAYARSHVPRECRKTRSDILSEALKAMDNDEEQCAGAFGRKGPVTKLFETSLASKGATRNRLPRHILEPKRFSDETPPMKIPTTSSNTTSARRENLRGMFTF